jgi:hypothetical protein
VDGFRIHLANGADVLMVVILLILWSMSWHKTILGKIKKSISSVTDMEYKQFMAGSSFVVFVIHIDLCELHVIALAQHSFLQCQN